MATAEQVADLKWRLNNLYYIKDKRGQKVKFKLNWAQEQLFNEMWYKNIILKARQLGMTTFIQIFMLDKCLFNSNKSAGVIAHNQDDAKKFFKNIIKFSYDCLPDVLKQQIKATNDSAGELAFSNGSSIRVGTSLRSGTYQYLHISEFGKLCAKYPDRAEEVVTGSLNTVAPDQFVFIESTAEGSYGRFYETCQDARELINTGQQLSSMDYRFHFYPWYHHPDYILDHHVQITDKDKSYFETLSTQGIDLSQERKNWYLKKEREQKSKMKQEYPSTPDEAFEVVSELAVYGEELGEVMREGRYCEIPYNKTKPVDVFLDIGKSTKVESTAAWFMQHDAPYHNFIDYYQSGLKTVGGYVTDILAKGYRIGRWFIPHDAESQKDYDLETFKTRLIDAGIDPRSIVVVPRVADISIGIDQMKEKFSFCRFDKVNCAEGWKALCAYNYSWDEKRAIVGAPIHNWASHPSDSIRQFAQGWYPVKNIHSIKRMKPPKLNIA